MWQVSPESKNHASFHEASEALNTTYHP